MGGNGHEPVFAVSVVVAGKLYEDGKEYRRTRGMSFRFAFSFLLRSNCFTHARAYSRSFSIEGEQAVARMVLDSLELQSETKASLQNAKGDLLQMVRACRIGRDPVYTVTKEEGTPHDKR